ncbi:MAG: tRNA (adenosine(37)-N6)-dimethylallyltransferase MiaA [bacterium]
MPKDRSNGAWRPIAVLVGATCTGKTAMAVALAGRLKARGISVEVIGADARQIYRSLCVGSSKPTLMERQAVPHHMIDVADPDETYNASRYAEEARNCVEEIYARGAYPLVVGGSGLYVRALIEGLFEGPGADPVIRLRLEEWAAREGSEALHSRLAECDPVTAENVHPNDKKRVIRALEVFETTGRPISALRAEGTGGGFSRPFYIGLDWPLEVHAGRIEDRICQMLKSGMQEEAAWLADANLTQARSFEGLGYEDALALHRGEIDREECVDRICKLHRNYAKRQRTWYRKIENVLWLEPAESDWDSLAERAAEALSGYFASSSSHLAESGGR